MRIIAWNIRAGGGRRSEAIAGQLRRWRPDVVALSEFRGTEPSRSIASALSAAGCCHQRSTADPHHPAVNALLVASRWPIRVVRLARASVDPRRWLHVSVGTARPFALLAVHVPNRVTGRKYAFLDAIADVARTWRGPPAIVAGDTNTGRIDIDEESPAFNQREDRWMQAMDALGWRDGFRALHPRRREFTWYSPNGRNGFRLDQAFVHPGLRPSVAAVVHRWGGAHGGVTGSLSDHAALVVDLERH